MKHSVNPLQSVLMGMIPVSLLLALPACPSPVEQDPLAGGALATFDVEGEEFSVYVTNDDTIRQLQDLQAGLSAANIPNGKLLEGSGLEEHNHPWTWHLDPEDISMAEMTTEVCDGLPSMVEEGKSEWVNNVGRYCPWSAELVALEDHRISE